MSFDIRTQSGSCYSFFSVDDLLTRHRRLMSDISHDHVVEFSVGDGNRCLEYFLENTVNVPKIVNTRRMVYFGELAHFLVYNLALSAEFMAFNGRSA